MNSKMMLWTNSSLMNETHVPSLFAYQLCSAWVGKEERAWGMGLRALDHPTPVGVNGDWRLATGDWRMVKREAGPVIRNHTIHVICGEDMINKRKWNHSIHGIWLVVMKL